MMGQGRGWQHKTRSTIDFLGEIEVSGVKEAMGMARRGEEKSRGGEDGEGGSGRIKNG